MGRAGVRVSGVSTEEDLSRVTVISTSRRVDLALPGSVTLAELLPSILRFSGLESNTPTDAVQTWVLQRFGSDPFDLYTPVNKLAIRDGETLYIRHRENAIPDAAFDDVVDAVAGATTTRPSWVAKHSQHVGIALMLAVLIGGPLLALNGARLMDDRMMLALAVGVTGFLSFASFIAAVAVARAARAYKTAAGLAWGSTVLAGMTGWYLAEVISQEEAPLAIRIIMASALVLVAAAASALAAKVHPMPLLAVSLTALFMLASSSFMVLYIGQEIRVAAVAMVVMAFLTTFLPTISYRVAGIALPNLPITTEAMLADETPVQSDIVARAVLADRLLGALLVATSATAVLSSFIVIRQGTLWSTLLVATIGLAFLLRARAFVGLTQRLALLLGGAVLVAVALLAVAWEAADSMLGVVLLFAGALLLTYLFAHYSASIYGKVLSPTWGRWGDIFEWLSIMAIIPALLGVLSLYGYFGSLLLRG